MDVKVGDVVRMRPMRVKAIYADAVCVNDNPGTKNDMWIDIDDIESIERPETDWSKVPWGTRVMVRDDDAQEWQDGIYVQFIRGATHCHRALGKAISSVSCWRYCELVEEQP